MKGLHDAIMRLPITAELKGYDTAAKLVYKLGHRDARHAAAELAIADIDLTEIADRIKRVALDVFDGPECSQAVRDAIEYFSAVLSVSSIDAVPQQPAINAAELTNIHELAKVFCISYASPHHIAFTLDGLRTLVEEAQKAKQ